MATAIKILENTRAIMLETADALEGLANSGFVWSSSRDVMDKRRFADALRTNANQLRAQASELWKAV